MDEHELSRRLDSAAAESSRPLDHEAIAAGVRGRRRRRHRSIGAGLAVCLVGVAAAAFALVDQDDTTDVQVVDPPATTTTTMEPGEDDGVVAAQLDEVELWQLQGSFLLHGSEGVSWLVDGHRERVWDEPVFTAYSDGAGGVVFQDAVSEEGWVRHDQGAIRWLGSDGEEPVEVAPDGQFAQLHGVVDLEGQGSVLFTRWFQWPDGPSAGTPEAVGSDTSQHLFALDLETGEERELGIVGGFDSPLRWIATGSDGLLLQICHLRCAIHDVIHNEGDPLDDPLVDWGYDTGVYATGLAAAGEMVATLLYEGFIDEQPSVSPSLVLLDSEGSPVKSIPIPGFDVDHVASGNVALALAHDATSALVRPLGVEDANSLLIRELDGDDPTIQRVLTDQALRFAPDAPVPGQGPPPVELEVEAMEVDLADLDGRFLMFGSDGIAWLENGALQQVWDQPVDQALPDGMGGVLFQDPGGSPWNHGEVTGAIRWLAAGDTTPTELVPEGERAQLHEVLILDGESTALFTSRSGGELEEGSETLFGEVLGSGNARPLAETGGQASGLDAIALTSEGLVFSGCHLQCTLYRLDPDGGGTTVQWADWSSGLAGSDNLLAFVAYLSPLQAGGYPGDPVLRLIDARNEPSEIERFGPPLVEVRLPHRLEGGWSSVDLGSGARSALVATSRPDEGFDVVLVTGLDTPEPRVQIVQTDQALRFG